MALHFRNVAADPTDPVDQWPYEALVNALERGGLRQWRRIASEIRRRPWGRTARSVEDYAASAEPDAVTTLLLRSVARARSAAARAESEEGGGRGEIPGRRLGPVPRGVGGGPRHLRNILAP